AAGRYEILGDMARREGGGLVYFGRDFATRQIVGLQLEQGPESTITMTATQFAPADPSFQMPESRRPSKTPAPLKVSISKEFPRVSRDAILDEGSLTPASGRPAVGEPTAYSKLLTRIAVAAVVVLVVVVASLLTCARPR
ncbi:MAG TPA: hypothetical protein VIP11_07055, partial [Gemmatimonadaceae bacterium]